MPDMPKHTNVLRRTGSSVYYFRITIPTDLRPHFNGKKDVWRSLQTRDLREANRLAARIRVEWDDQFAELRAKDKAAVVVSLSDDDISRIVHMHQSRMMTFDSELRSQGLDNAKYEQLGDDLSRLDQDARAAIARGDTWSVGNALEDSLRFEGIELDTSSVDYKRLVSAASKAYKRTVDALKARHEGEVVDDVPMPSLAPLQARAAIASKGAPTLVDILNKYQTERKLKSKSFDDMLQVVNRFHDCIGTLPVKQILKAHGLKYKEALLQKGLSAKTINSKHLAFLKTLLNWAAQNDYIEQNPIASVRVVVGKVQKESRTSYDLKALQAIFNSPIYATENARPVAGKGETAFWLPLLGLFTGARLEELAQLKVSDIVKDSLGRHIHITDRDDEGSVKTNESRRRVPLHSELERMGFGNYLETLPPTGYLFPELTPDKYGKRSSLWSQWWGKWCRKQLGITDKRMVFHSFRHSFKDICREAEVDEETHDALTGHTNSSTSRSYGSGTYPLSPLFVAIGQLNFKNIGLSHISWQRSY
ncbi:hypothetical protein DBB33_06180 [Chromobacterium haemolyticum]|nr:hypothetical protein DBB33_06180 [Chromobacterium haemolyticum]